MNQPATQDTVKTTLTPDGTADSATSELPAASTRGRKRSRAEVENTDYAAFATRVIRAHARRVADGDVDALADLLRLAAEVDTATQTAVTGLRAFGYSWGEIATRLGTTRQAAQQRWGR
ncbi:hypothetical protein [Kineosporia sp. R_H_3]|uniref:hypothetical protein n=1 Tax=Kineosporia sp. R_H_3 TaxID=1961848 RepID=UPI0018E9E7AC|nr:hypothetical protein [Kineosporia sp. R_H_3]